MSGKVLIVDDEIDNVTYLVTVLEDAGYPVVSATTADEALRLARKDAPALICLDVMMPRRSGVSLYKELRSDPALRSVPTVFISAVENSANFRGARFRKLVPDRSIPEPDAFFEKPIDVAAFVRFVGDTLGPPAAGAAPGGTADD